MELRAVIVESLIDTIIEVLSSTLNAVPLVTQKELDVLPQRGSVIVSIGVAGKLEGALVLIFSEKSVCEIVSKMFSFEAKDVNADVLDGAGEVANILAGGLKSRIVNNAGEGYEFNVSLPTVINGKSELSVVEQGKSTSVDLGVACGDISFGVKFFYSVGYGSSETEKKAAKRVDMSRSLKDLISKSDAQKNGA